MKQEIQNRKEAKGTCQIIEKTDPRDDCSSQSVEGLVRKSETKDCGKPISIAVLASRVTTRHSESPYMDNKDERMRR